MRRFSLNNSESDDSDVSTEGVQNVKERDPSTVSFGFLRTDKSKKEGVLITHDMFKFQKNGYSRDGSRWWYVCSHKPTHGCTARAIVMRREVPTEDGGVEVENSLLEVATPEVMVLVLFHFFYV